MTLLDVQVTRLVFVNEGRLILKSSKLSFSKFPGFSGLMQCCCLINSDSNLKS
jgi:hypothetical protein